MRLIEDIKAVIFIIQAFLAGGKNVVLKRVISALYVNIKIFIKKIKEIKDLNILYILKSIEVKINK